MRQHNVELPLFFRQDKNRSLSASQLANQSNSPDELEPQRQLAGSATVPKCCSKLVASRNLATGPQPITAPQQPSRGQFPSEEIHSANSSSNEASASSSAMMDADNSSQARSESRQSLRLPSHPQSSAAADSALQAQRLQSQRLRQVERKLRSSLNLATVLGATVVETAAFLQARQVSLLRYDTLIRRWQPVAQYCENQTLAWQPPFSFDQDEFSTTIDRLWQGNPVSICVDTSSVDIDTDSTEIGRALADEACRWQSQWAGNWLLIPVKRRQTIGYSLNEPLLSDRSAADEEQSGLKNSQEHWGIMALAAPDRQQWSSEAIGLVQSIVVELEWAIAQAYQHQELLQANQELQKLALSDGLTRLANRRRFDEHLSDEWQRLARDRQPLSLILCDLDHFKRYNDTFGHPAGDRCLIRVARALLNGPQRPADLVARYGGEEFAVILPNTDTHGAWRIAQKIHDNIRALNIEHAPDNEEKYVTVTMGVSTVLPGHKSTAQMLVQASDLALYHAKQQGRNRTYVHAHYNTVEADFEQSSESLDMTPAE